MGKTSDKIHPNYLSGHEEDDDEDEFDFEGSGKYENTPRLRTHESFVTAPQPSQTGIALFLVFYPVIIILIGEL